MIIVVVNVYKRFFYFSIKNAFLTFFYFSNVFIFFVKKTSNNQCENNSNLIHFCPKTENQTVAHKLIVDFVL